MCRSRNCCSVTGVGVSIEQVLAALRLRERDHVADRFRRRTSASTMRSRPNAMPPCGGAPYCSASSRKPNLLLLVLGRRCRATRTPSPARPAGGSAPSRRRSPSRSARRRRPSRARCAGIRREQLLVAVLRRGERMMARGPRLRVVVELEHREVDDPQRLPARLGKAAVVADLGAQRAERVVDDLLAVGAEEDEVARLARRCARGSRAAPSAGRNLTIGDCSPSSFGLGDVVDLDVREAARRRRSSTNAV